MSSGTERKQFEISARGCHAQPRTTQREIPSTPPARRKRYPTASYAQPLSPSAAEPNKKKPRVSDEPKTGDQPFARSTTASRAAADDNTEIDTTTSKRCSLLDSSSSSVVPITRAHHTAAASDSAPVTPAPRRQIHFSDPDDTPDAKRPSSPGGVKLPPGVINIFPGSESKARCCCPTEPQRHSLACCDVGQVFTAQYGPEHLDFLHEKELRDHSAIRRLRREQHANMKGADSGDVPGTPSSKASSASSLASSTQSGDAEASGIVISVLAHGPDPPAEAMFLESNVNLLSQPNLTAKMRAVLISWLVEVVMEYKLSDATFHIAVSILDAILRAGPTARQHKQLIEETRGYIREAGMTIGDDEEFTIVQEDRINPDWFFCLEKNELQAVGCTCIWLASKLEDRHPVTQDQLSFISDNSVSTSVLRDFEYLICRQLNFDVQCLTPLHYVNTFLRASQACPCHRCEFDHPVLRQMMMYLIYLSRLPIDLMDERPSKIAAAALYLSRASLGHASPKQVSGSGYPHRFWSRTLEYYTGYTPRELTRAVLFIYRYQLQAEQLGVPQYEKFKKERHHCVARRTAPRLDDLDLPGVDLRHEDLMLLVPAEEEEEPQQEQEAVDI